MSDLGKGVGGGQDVFIVTDLFSGLRVAYPALAKTAQSTTIARRMFAGRRTIHKLYVERLGEISRSQHTWDIMPQGNQPGAPQTNAVVERANGEV